MPELYPEDQKKVDEFISSNVNSVERTQFKPLTLLLVIFVVLAVLTVGSYLIAVSHGVV